MEQLKRYQKEKPKIQQQFAHLKRTLADVTDEEWNNMPEVSDISGRNKKTKNTKERYHKLINHLL